MSFAANNDLTSCALPTMPRSGPGSDLSWATLAAGSPESRIEFSQGSGSERVLELLGALSEHAKGEYAKGKHAKGEHAERELEAVEVFVSSGYLNEAKRALKAGGYAATFDTKY